MISLQSARFCKHQSHRERWPSQTIFKKDPAKSGRAPQLVKMRRARGTGICSAKTLILGSKLQRTIGSVPCNSEKSDAIEILVFRTARRQLHPPIQYMIFDKFSCLEITRVIRDFPSLPKSWKKTTTYLTIREKSSALQPRFMRILKKPVISIHLRRSCKQKRRVIRSLTKMIKPYQRWLLRINLYNSQRNAR